MKKFYPLTLIFRKKQNKIENRRRLSEKTVKINTHQNKKPGSAIKQKRFITSWKNALQAGLEKGLIALVILHKVTNKVIVASEVSL